MTIDADKLRSIILDEVEELRLVYPRLNERDHRLENMAARESLLAIYQRLWIEVKE